MTLNDLKAHAYDIIAAIEYHNGAVRELRNQLDSVNGRIAEEAEKGTPAELRAEAAKPDRQEPLPDPPTAANVGTASA